MEQVGGSGTLKLSASDGDADDAFGAAVALSVDAAIVGAPSHEAPNVDGSGAAYAFARSEGEWGYESKLVSESDGREGFGVSVDCDGDAAVIGAASGDSDGFEPGAAHVFTRGNGSWQRAATLTAEDDARGSFFGASVAIAGDVAIVGAPSAVGPNHQESGAAYVFEREGDEWHQQAKLTEHDGDTVGERLGWSVDLDGETALVGAYGDDTADPAAGAAYVYVRDQHGWRRQTRITGDHENLAYFGSAVALRGDHALAGAPQDSHPHGSGSGAVYAFERTGESWSERSIPAPAGIDSHHNVGNAVALTDAAALVGAPGIDSPNGTSSGAAHVYTRSSDGWAEESTVTPPDGENLDAFGGSVAMVGSAMLVGAPSDDNENGEDAGAAYLFER